MNQRSTSRDGFATAVTDAEQETLQQLVDRYVPSITDDDIRTIEALLWRAQSQQPEDVRSFVDDMNRLLDACGLRIQTDTGELGVLNCRNKPGGRQQIRITGPSSGRQAFQSNTLSVVRIDGRISGRRLDLHFVPPGRTLS